MNIDRKTPYLGPATDVDSARRYSRLNVIYSDAFYEVPAPLQVPAIRRSLAQTRARNHIQVHVDPSWGREGHGGNRFPRFSLLGTIFAAGGPPSEPPRRMIPQRRYTKVVRYPRRVSVPGVYGVEPT